MTLEQFKRWFDPQLSSAVDQLARQSVVHVKDPFLARLINHTVKLINHGGKRIRPYLAAQMYESTGGKRLNSITNALIGIELYHTFCLIHDDIMDHGTTRHGIPTLHVWTASALRKEKCLGDATHVGQSQAILAGDMVCAWAFERFGAVGNTRANTYFEALVREVIAGQMIDVNLTTKNSATVQQINQKMRLKTARYTFVYPLKIGAALAGHNSDQFSEKFGTALGLAYQIQDDLLDITTSTQELTKTTGNDLRYRQHTLFTYYLMHYGGATAKKELERWFGNPSHDDRATIVQLFHSSGAIQYGQRAIQKHLNEARIALDQQSFKPDHAAIWNNFIAYLTSRSS